MFRAAAVDVGRVDPPWSRVTSPPTRPRNAEGTVKPPDRLVDPTRSRLASTGRSRALRVSTARRSARSHRAPRGSRVSTAPVVNSPARAAWPTRVDPHTQLARADRAGFVPLACRPCRQPTRPHRAAASSTRVDPAEGRHAEHVAVRSGPRVDSADGQLADRVAARPGPRVDHAGRRYSVGVRLQRVDLPCRQLAPTIRTCVARVSTPQMLNSPHALRSDLPRVDPQTANSPHASLPPA